MDIHATPEVMAAETPAHLLSLSSSVAVATPLAAASVTQTAPPLTLYVAQPSKPKPRRSMTIKRRREPLEPLIVDILRAAGRRGLVLVDIYRQLIARGVDCCDDGGGGGGGGGDDDDDGHRPHIGGSDGVAWRKNVRHILTVREFFVKTGVKNPEGRGQYWRFDEGKYEEYVGDRRKVASAASGSSEAISNHDEIIDDAFDCVATSSQFVDQQNVVSTPPTACVTSNVDYTCHSMSSSPVNVGSSTVRLPTRSSKTGTENISYRSMVQPAAGLPNIAFSSQSVHSGSRQMIGSAPDPHQLRLHSQRAYEHQQVQQQFPVADWSAAASCASPTAKGLSLCRTSSSYYDSGNNNLGTSIDPYALPYVNTSHSFNHRPQSACAWKQQPAAFSSFASTAPPVVSPERQAYGNERQYNRCWGVVQGHQRQQQQHASSTTSNMRFVSPSPGGTVQKTSPESSFSAPRFWRLQQWFRRETPLQQQSLQLSTSRTAVAAVTSQYTRAKYWQASNGRDFGCRTSNYSAFDEMQQSTPCSLLPDCDHQMHRDGLYVGQNVQSRPTEKLD